MTPDRPTQWTLYSLAQAVLQLADGMGGDDQEQDRAQTIAAALTAVANGTPVDPIAPHGDARAAWFGEDEDAPDTSGARPRFRRLERLEDAEARCDAVMLDPAATYEQKHAACAALYRRAFQDPADAARAIADLTPAAIDELVRQHEVHAARG